MLAPEHVKRVAVIGGGGLMGHGIALACLQKGYEVTLVSRRGKTLEHGIGLIKDGPFGLAKAVKRGKLTTAEADSCLARVRGSTDYAEGVGQAEVVLESIPEEVQSKRECFRLIESLAPADAVFASNTSSILIAELAGALARPERLVGTHWFYPANVMPLVEVSRSELTSDQALEFMVAFLGRMGKKPVVVRDSPGFFMTRFINTYIAEAIRLVELGIAGVREVDEMVKAGLGWPMGIFELLDDTASFDSWYHAQRYLWETCGERYVIPPLARKVFEAGYRGRPELKPGSKGGWYDFFKEPRIDKKVTQ
ncbi:MAG: 3-hydroxyacyl-CoA dehydrogenase family protein [Candidatus Methylomirabilia bacterium]